MADRARSERQRTTTSRFSIAEEPEGVTETENAAPGRRLTSRRPSKLIGAQTLEMYPDDNQKKKFVHFVIEGFRRYGFIIARHPWKAVIIVLFISLLGLGKILLTKQRNNILAYTPYGARSNDEHEVYYHFFNSHGTPVVTNLFAQAKDNGSMIRLEHLVEFIKAVNHASDNFTLTNPNTGKEENFNEFCTSFCRANEPIVQFANGLYAIQQGIPTDRIFLNYPISSVLGTPFSLQPNFFGIETYDDVEGDDKVTNLLKNGDGVDDQILGSNVTLDSDWKQKYKALTNLKSVQIVGAMLRAEHKEGWTDDQVKDYEMRIIDYFTGGGYHSDLIDVYVTSQTYIEEEMVRSGKTLLPYLTIGFIIMCTCSCVTVLVRAWYMDQHNWFKVILALSACITPLLATATALSIMFTLGARFSSILCVVPFLVLAIGVDSSYLMIHEWQRVAKHAMEYPHKNDNVGRRMSDVLSEIGPAILISCLTNMFADGVGAFTSSPEITLLCAANACSMCVAFVYQMTFYSGLMVIVGEKEMHHEEVCEKKMPIDSVEGGADRRMEDIKEVEEHSLNSGDDSVDGKSDTPTVPNGLKNGHSLSLGAHHNGAAHGHAPLAARLSSLSQGMGGHKPLQRVTSDGRRSSVFYQTTQPIVSSFMRRYVTVMARTAMSLFVVGIYLTYLAFSIWGISRININLTPDKLFPQDSPLTKMDILRSRYIVPTYNQAAVFVQQPGNLSDPERLRELNQLVIDFESIPGSWGPNGTKYFMREFQPFLESLEGEIDFAEAFEDNTDREIPQLPVAPTKFKEDELQYFIKSGDSKHWSGFIKMKNATGHSHLAIMDEFFFTSGFRGLQHVEWRVRGNMLKQWRKVVDKYPQFKASVFNEDSQFFDLIDNMATDTWQSVLGTLCCMAIICFLFLNNWFTVAIASLSVLSICCGILGIISWMGIDLDPITMAVMIISTGFSVDIPAHVSYHYYQATRSVGPLSRPEDRLTQCLSSVAFPAVQAACSTILCISSLAFVHIYMAEAAVKIMVICVVLCNLHGLLFLPAVLICMDKLTSVCRSKAKKAQRDRITPQPPKPQRIRATGTPNASTVPDRPEF